MSLPKQRVQVIRFGLFYEIVIKFKGALFTHSSFLTLILTFQISLVGFDDYNCDLHPYFLQLLYQFCGVFCDVPGISQRTQSYRPTFTQTYFKSTQLNTRNIHHKEKLHATTFERSKQSTRN